MLDFAFFYYIVVCSVAILLNSFIILASTRSYIRGEFKWVFVGAAVTNLLLSISQLLLMPSAMKWPGKNEYSVVVTSNPLVQQVPRVWCEFLFDFFYFRQWEAVVLSICIVPLNRAIAVCWKHMAPSNAKFWIGVAFVPNVLPFLVAFCSHYLGMTRFADVAIFPSKARISLVNRIESENYCTLRSNYRKPGDIMTTAFLIFCPSASYVITIVAMQAAIGNSPLIRVVRFLHYWTTIIAKYCVVKLFLFIRHSKVNVRSTVSRQAINRQKSILATICIQAAVPLLTYLPLFLSILVVDNSWGISSDGAQWYDMGVVHYAAAFGPAIDALATIACLKPYRRAFLELIGIASTRTEQKITAFRKKLSTAQNIVSTRKISQQFVIQELDVQGFGARNSTIESAVDVAMETRPMTALSGNGLRETRV